MFERFTRSARNAVIDAQEVARSTGSSRVDTRHVLVALLGGDGDGYVGAVCDAVRAAGGDPARIAALARGDIESSGLDRDALASIGIDLDAVTERADEVFGAGALGRGRRTRRHIPFTRDAKKALELALREAIRLGERSIDTRHLLLGLLRADCPGRASLAENDVDLALLRRRLEQPEPRSA